MSAACLQSNESPEGIMAFGA